MRKDSKAYTLYIGTVGTNTHASNTSLLAIRGFYYTVSRHPRNTKPWHVFGPLR